MGKFITVANSLFVWAVIAASRASSLLVQPHLDRRDIVPSVDLGYETHTATINATGDYYSFKNIPYAEQPVGSRRFAIPVLPIGNSSKVNNGSENVVCMQSAPEWLLTKQAEAHGVTLEQITKVYYESVGQMEACLALDVYVPQAIFNGTLAKAPVLIWIHGGGFTSGSKQASSPPAGLIGRSTLNGNDGLIYVAINYRLGMFGWLGGHNDVTPNLGLQDQAVAFQWVQKYIGLFGGDASRVTIMGESAGAASILHHITSPTQVNFSQAIMQSPSFQFDKNISSGYESVMVEATRETGSTIATVADLAELNSDTLKAINEAVVFKAPYAKFSFGPAPDGNYVPALPQVRLAQGNFNKHVRVMSGHNVAESGSFMPTNLTTVGDSRAFFSDFMLESSNDTLNYILDVLYPIANYSSELLRDSQIVTDSSFSCSTRFLGKAFNDAAHNYLFAVEPGYHAEDVPYTFFNGATSTLVNGVPVNETIAHALQDYIVGFAMTGDPNKSPAGPAALFSSYGSNAQILELGSTGLITRADDMDNVRCAWWQQAFVDGLIRPITINNSTATSNSTGSPPSPTTTTANTPLSTASSHHWNNQLVVTIATFWLLVSSCLG